MRKTKEYWNYKRGYKNKIVMLSENLWLCI